jgi:hypothetical protein
MLFWKKCVKVYLFWQVMPENRFMEGESGGGEGPDWGRRDRVFRKEV